MRSFYRTTASLKMQTLQFHISHWY